MKKLIILSLCLLTLGVKGQFTYPNMNVTNLLGIPQSASPSIGSASNAIKYLVYNTTTGTVQVYNGTTFTNVGGGGGGSGTVTSITPAFGFTSATPITTSGTLTVDTTSAVRSFLNSYSKTQVQGFLSAKQVTLVSATNIKTINGSSILGSGDLVVSGGTNYWTQASGALNPTAFERLVISGAYSGAYSILAVNSSNTGAISAVANSGTGVGINAVAADNMAATFTNTGTTSNSPTIRAYNNSGNANGFIAKFLSGSGSAVSVSGIDVNGLYKYDTDQILNYTDRTAPDWGNVKKLTASYPYLSKTASYTVLSTDWANTNTLTIIVDATAGNVVITLPTASTVAGKIIMVKRMDNSANTLTVNGGGTNIDGTSTVAVSMQYGNAMIQSISTQYITL